MEVQPNTVGSKSQGPLSEDLSARLLLFSVAYCDWWLDPVAEGTTHLVWEHKNPFSYNFFFLTLETWSHHSAGWSGSHCVACDGIKLVMFLLPQLPKWWDCRHEPSSMAGRCSFIQMEMGSGDLEACGEVVWLSAVDQWEGLLGQVDEEEGPRSPPLGPLRWTLLPWGVYWIFLSCIPLLL